MSFLIPPTWCQATSGAQLNTSDQAYNPTVFKLTMLRVQVTAQKIVYIYVPRCMQSTEVTPDKERETNGLSSFSH